jgi:hypothetical protein
MTLPATARAAGWDATARRLAPAHAEAPTHADPAVTLWSHVATLTAWLDAASPPDSHQVTLRVLKLAEETGEAVAAYIGMTGANPRKGICATAADVHRELCDVAITALVALATLTGGPAAAQDRLQHHLLTRAARLTARIHDHRDEAAAAARAS